MSAFSFNTTYQPTGDQQKDAIAQIGIMQTLGPSPRNCCLFVNDNRGGMILSEKTFINFMPS